MKRYAFTMLELIFVIIVIGILAVLAMPSFNRNPLAEATEQIANHIRYAQHLAMVDDKFDTTDPTWWRERWQIRFYEYGTPDNYYYAVYSDRDQNRRGDTAAGKDEVAEDPNSGKLLIGDNAFMNLTSTFGITNVSSSCYSDDATLMTANKGSLAFDTYGRPYTGSANATSPFAFLLKQPCTITLTGPGGETSQITIQPETGYVRTIIP